MVATGHKFFGRSTKRQICYAWIRWHLLTIHVNHMLKISIHTLHFQIINKVYQWEVPCIECLLPGSDELYFLGWQRVWCYKSLPPRSLSHVHANLHQYICLPMWISISQYIEIVKRLYWLHASMVQLLLEMLDFSCGEISLIEMCLYWCILDCHWRICKYLKLPVSMYCL